MSIFDVHVNRWPVSGKVRKITHVPGGFVDARFPAASLTNEHNSIVLDTTDGPIEVVQIAGMIARQNCLLGPGRRSGSTGGAVGPDSIWIESSMSIFRRTSPLP